MSQPVVIFIPKIIVQLKEHHPQLFFKINDAVAIFIDQQLHIVQSPQVTDYLRDLWKEPEPLRSFFAPGDHLLPFGHIVKCSVQLDRIKLTGIIGQFIFGTAGIEIF